MGPTRLMSKTIVVQGFESLVENNGFLLVLRYNVQTYTIFLFMF